MHGRCSFAHKQVDLALVLYEPIGGQLQAVHQAHNLIGRVLAAAVRDLHGMGSNRQRLQQQGIELTMLAAGVHGVLALHDLQGMGSIHKKLTA